MTSLERETPIEEASPGRRGGVDDIVEMVRRMRGQCEREMTNEFSPDLSLRLDLCLVLEQCVEEVTHGQ